MKKSEKNLKNIHTKEHKKDPTTGRSPEIEGYITLSCAHVIDFVRSRANLERSMFIDIGCDYGKAVHFMSDFVDGAYGFEPNNDFNPFDVEILQEEYSYKTVCNKIVGSKLEFADSVNGSYDCSNYIFFLNHSFEHIENYSQLLREIKGTITTLKEKHKKEELCADSFPKFFIFIAVPKVGTDWAYWEGHVTLWDKIHLENIIVRNFEIGEYYTKEKCFRENNVELWLTAEVVG